MEGWKKTILNILGVISTAATLAIIYFVLFMTGVIRELDNATIIEYTVLLVLALSTKSFWYASIENSVRTSDSHKEMHTEVLTIMNEEVEDTFDFDRFIHYENINNYNTYVLNRCVGLTVDNYKYTFRDKLERLIRKLIRCSKPKKFYAERFVKRVMYKASKLHKLSAANILTFRQTNDGLTDDRNPSNKQKAVYLIGGSLTSAILMFVTAIIGFEAKDSVDTRAAIIKMVMYSVQILMSILQTILQANINVNKGDRAYFRSLINIFAKYKDYKLKRQPVKYIEYSLEEINYAIDTDSPASSTAERYDNLSTESRQN